MKVKEIEIGFENCEVCKLEPSMFKYLVINGIKVNRKINCYQYENGEMQINLSCEYFSITINKEGLNQKCWEDRRLEERLKENDIVAIRLIYDNAHEEDIYVPWNEEDDYKNKYQKNEYQDSENLHIEIEKI